MDLSASFCPASAADQSPILTTFFVIFWGELLFPFEQVFSFCDPIWSYYEQKMTVIVDNNSGEPCHEQNKFVRNSNNNNNFIIIIIIITILMILIMIFDAL